MADLIVTVSYCGIRVFRYDNTNVEYFMQDDCVLEIMDANTGEIYKQTPGWDPMFVMQEISELVKGQCEK